MYSWIDVIWKRTKNEVSKNMKKKSVKGAMRHQHANNFTMKRKEKKKKIRNELKRDKADNVNWFTLLNEKNMKFPFWQYTMRPESNFLRTHDIMPPSGLIFMFFMWLKFALLALHVFFLFCCQFSQFEHKCFETMCNFTKK